MKIIINQQLQNGIAKCKQYLARQLNYLYFTSPASLKSLSCSKLMNLTIFISPSERTKNTCNIQSSQTLHTIFILCLHYIILYMTFIDMISGLCPNYVISPMLYRADPLQCKLQNTVFCTTCERQWRWTPCLHIQMHVPRIQIHYLEVAKLVNFEVQLEGVMHVSPISRS